MDDIDRRLLDEFQRDFPLTSRPFAAIAERLEIGEDEVIERLGRLSAEGAVARIGAVFRPGAVGVSTLAAMAVPEDRIDEVAALISGLDAVNHNYEREHGFNLWFVVHGPDEAALAATVAAIEKRTRLAVMTLPMLEDYRLDLGFPIRWN